MSFFRFLFGKKDAAEAAEVLDKQDFKKALASSGVQLVDVRTPKEYKRGHIEGARNIDYFNPFAFKEAAAQLDKDRPVYLYCQSGNRSLKSARRLKDMGFEKIYDLKGGYNSWN